MKIYLKIFIIFLVIFILSLVCILYGRNTLEHVNYNEYITNSKYMYFDTNIYNLFPELEGFLITDEEINNAQDLVNLSNYVVLIEVYDEPMLQGEDVINNGIIKKIIKGNGLNVGDKIQIYDLVYGWSKDATNYFAGSTPLKVGEEYIVFLKKAPYPTVKNTYVFDSIKFGHVITSKPNKYVLGYDMQTLKIEDMLKIKDIQEYAYVFTKNYTDDDVKKYEKIVKEIYDLIK